MDSTTIQAMVAPPIRALAPSMIGCAPVTPMMLLAEPGTSAMPPMQMTTPTTVGGNTGRRWRTSGASTRAVMPCTSAAPARPPGPWAVIKAAAKVIMNGSGMWISSAPEPQRPPQACRAVHSAMPSSVMATMVCVPVRSSPAILAATST